MKKAISLLFALSLGVGIVGCSGEEPIEKTAPVTAENKNNFGVSVDKGAGATSEDGAPAGKSGG
jgi:hypothetical protein